MFQVLYDLVPANEFRYIRVHVSFALFPILPAPNIYSPLAPLGITPKEALLILCNPYFPTVLSQLSGSWMAPRPCQTPSVFSTLFTTPRFCLKCLPLFFYLRGVPSVREVSRRVLPSLVLYRRKGTFPSFKSPRVFSDSCPLEECSPPPCFRVFCVCHPHPAVPALQLFRTC